MSEQNFKLYANRIYNDDGETVGEMYANKVTFEDGFVTAGTVSYDNTGTGLTASDVQGAIDEVTDSLNSFRHLNYIDKVYASVTLNANGYFKFADTPEGLPTGIGTIVMANVYNWGLVSSKDAINVTPIYVMGTANATIANLAVRFWYV